MDEARVASLGLSGTVELWPYRCEVAVGIVDFFMKIYCCVRAVGDLSHKRRKRVAEE